MGLDTYIYKTSDELYFRNFTFLDMIVTEICLEGKPRDGDDVYIYYEEAQEIIKSLKEEYKKEGPYDDYDKLNREKIKKAIDIFSAIDKNEDIIYTIT